MDKISSYFNDCFSDNYFVFVLSHKSNVNIDEEAKHIETTKTIVFDQSIREDSTISKDNEPEEEKRNSLSQKSQPQAASVPAAHVAPASKLAVITKETVVTHYVANLNLILQPTKIVKGYTVYPLHDKRNKIYTERYFEDFGLLRKALCAHFPACFIPVIPPKDFIVFF